MTQKLEMDYKDLQTRYNGLVETTQKQGDKITELMNEVLNLTHINTRLGNELAAAHSHAQLLGTHANEQGQASGAEIQRLRSKLKVNGISPEAN
jgi:hypothetical protein